jgi:outer membrane receptor for ferrienterochelin and colicins
MRFLQFFLIISALFSTQQIFAQHTDANIFGDVQSNGEHVPFVNVYIDGTTIGTSTDETGHYMIIDIPEGKYTIVAKAMGYKTQKKEIAVTAGKTSEVNFVLEEETMSINEVVVTGTKTFKRQTESAVIVNVMDSKTLQAVEACNISEGLKFQPGLRVETDCQTCNYTQLRMNGLGGGYSQILINGRPIFSPLTGLYGMEQIPANMVDRIEVVRGGGSALYGSSAIGGTVNIITTIPKKNYFELSNTTNCINGSALDNVFNGNINLVNHKRNAGISVFVNRRHRDGYDHNSDNFSELPELKNNSFGTNMFFKPRHNQKLEFSMSSLTEYRFGGEMTEKAAYLAEQSEERTHHVLMGSLDYQVNFNGDNSSFIAYAAGQLTNRDHYTGIVPDKNEDPVAYSNHFINPPYGNTENSTYQAGTQVNHRALDFPLGANVFTVGGEFVYDDVMDSISAYNYSTDQRTQNFGGFFQSDWDLWGGLNLLTGIRVDKHNLVDKVIASPRISLLYKMQNYMQWRITWGTGFRAPQAFDTDLHMAFAGGGISRVMLAKDLCEERSQSLSASVNYDKATADFVAGFTLEGFYTKLNNVFYLEPIGNDAFGDVFEKRNGSGAIVQGTTLEVRANYNRKAQLEAGFTLQQSLYDNAVENLEGKEKKREFLRTPNQYGYTTLTYTPNKKFSAALSSIYTGPMQLVHFAPDANAEDRYVTSKAFTEFNIKVGYTFSMPVTSTGLEFYGGIKNITNAYQSDFDKGKNRDSNYIYGPGTPRIFYVGIKLKAL